MRATGAEEAERALRVIRDTAGDRVRRGVPLAPLTSLRVGGPAAVYLEAESLEDLAAAARAVDRTGVPVLFLGRGSNLLVPDEGFPGLVIRLGRGFRWAARDRDRLSAGGAMPLPALAGVALAHRLAGLEFGVAIPASVGGAVRMNAGAHGREMREVVGSVELFLLRDGETRTIPGADAGFRYRGSSFPSGSVVIGATVELAPGDPEAIRAEMDEVRRWRRATQPLAEPNCGSVFKNPDGDHAARLIEAAGAKGLAVGGARVSEKHANFVITAPGARAADVVALIDAVRDRVRDRAGIELETEVHVAAPGAS